MKILYITFIDENKSPTSGSEVRPIRFLEAMNSVADDVKVVYGVTNSRKARQNATKQVRTWLKDWTPDLCYIEPPSGPLFFLCDQLLIMYLYRKGIPIGLFYRDAYWKFPSSIKEHTNVNPKDLIKSLIIRFMQQRDWFLYNKCCKVIYFPTELMTSYFNCKKVGVLPPGCLEISSEIKEKNEMPNAIYVGGATIRYGIKLLLDSAISINRDKTRFTLSIVCPKDNWDVFIQQYPEYADVKDWLQVFHIGEGKKLDEIYSNSDFAIVPLLCNQYNDFVFPVKLVEYVSRLLPVVSTSCVETKKFVEENGVGIVANDTIQDFSNALLKMASDTTLRHKYSENCIESRKNNSWESRAIKVINDLYSEKYEE